MQRLLDQPVQYRRNAQRPETPACLGNLNPPYRQRLIAAFTQPFFDLWPVRAQKVSQLLNAHTVYSWGTFVLLHTTIGQLHV